MQIIVKTISLGLLVMLGGCSPERYDSNQHFTDPALHNKLIKYLESEGIPYKTYYADGGKEYVSWPSERNDEVSPFLNQIKGANLPPGHAMTSGSKTLQYYKKRFEESSLPFEVVTSYGETYLTWSKENDEMVQKIFEAPIPKGAIN
jgi:hypothetical protein